ncbi:hypothetical protein HYN49_06745 [Flavobacterium pallidum]|uniref:Uncharacterized protein n=1 Tax=Flavobacterium pallidum TaxID=2172098 RepID=A0A2S1SGS4_9FLAO|nr:hypothetical protein HYN49_06745 [Flavobacterium pallidum]
MNFELFFGRAGGRNVCSKPWQFDRAAVGLYTAIPRSFLAAGFPLPSLTRTKLQNQNSNQHASIGIWSFVNSLLTVNRD